MGSHSDVEKQVLEISEEHLETAVVAMTAWQIAATLALSITFK